MYHTYISIITVIVEREFKGTAERESCGKVRGRGRGKLFKIQNR